MNQQVLFEVYVLKNGEILPETMERLSYDLSMRMIDVRDEIMWKIYNSTDERNEQDEYYLQIENRSPNLVKEFGKLFFNKGLLPHTIDNYPLSRITSAGNMFIFGVYRVKKSELKDYVPVKRYYEMSSEEKSSLNEKAASKNKTFVTPAWSSSEDEEENVKKPDYSVYANIYQKKKYQQDEW